MQDDDAKTANEEVAQDLLGGREWAKKIYRETEHLMYTDPRVKALMERALATTAACAKKKNPK